MLILLLPGHVSLYQTDMNWLMHL